ncbi:MAG TPA: hypothetical protein VGP21_08300 [Opitutaceae bacterium]|nr:hypothetical protein [Opitutaceae bacterium]
MCNKDGCVSTKIKEKPSENRAGPSRRLLLVVRAGGGRPAVGHFGAGVGHAGEQRDGARRNQGDQQEGGREIRRDERVLARPRIRLS